jgi:hypothetical protein
MIVSPSSFDDINAPSPFGSFDYYSNGSSKIGGGTSTTPPLKPVFTAL